MGRFQLVVISRPKDGRDAEYNDWYTNRHLADVVALPGFSSAQRFRRVAKVSGDVGMDHLAIYEIDADSAEDALASLNAASGDPEKMPISDALDLDAVVAAVYEVHSPVVTAQT
ncbi:MAG TPA: hypothetical protein VJM34_07995 [Novosphingobium sp.]|nr:hypothetical protein [Novosphingobium sp.]